ncbi:MAG: sigma-70 family RNA polymerase sigma factor [Bacteroidales bacterium]|nr:sigma-70 family RNA polymerase sigma factor [Bacteroidales bacterium]
MFGVCRYYSKDYTEAEDVLHEGFIKVFKKINQFEGKGVFEGWLRRVFVNTALERYRKQNILYPVEDYHQFVELADNYNAVEQITTKDLYAIIQELSPKYKMVFNLYAIEGYQHKEIAEMLGISEGTSKSNLARARTILQKKVKERFSSIDQSISL